MLKRLIMIGLFLALVAPLWTCPAAPAGAQGGGQAYSGLDIVFAVDVSGSMYYEITRNNHFDRDRGLRFLYQQAGDFDTLPTDPNNLRFETIEFLIAWMQDFIPVQQAQERSLDVNVSMVTFDDQPQLALDWVNLNTYDPSDPERPNALDFTLPDPILAESNSDFILLYNLVNQVFQQRPPSTATLPRRQVMFLITDSVPCGLAESGTSLNLIGADGSTVREQACASRNPIENHLRSANLDPTGGLSNVEKQLFIIPPSNGDPAVSEAVRGVFASLPWESVSNQSVTYVPNVQALPALLFQDILLAIADVVDVREPEDSQTFTRLGLTPVQSNFVVPPYQASMEALVFAAGSQPGARPRFSVNGDEVSGQTLASSDSGSLNRLAFNQPVPGRWEVRSDTESVQTWVSFEASQGEFRFVTPSEEATQYSPLEFAYRIVDDEGALLPIRADYLPQVEVTLSGSGGAASYITPDLTLEEGELRGVYYPTQDGRYRLSGEVNPDPDWETGGISLRFLNPLEEASLSVSELRWGVQFGTEEQAATIRNGILQISRRDALPVSVQLLAGETPLRLPDNITAQLIFSPVEGQPNACPEQASLSLQKTQPDLFISPDFRFPEAGECQVGLVVSAASPLPPLNGESAVIYEDVTLGRVRATQTIRLNVALLDSDATPSLPNPSDNPLPFTMRDVASQPTFGGEALVTWAEESLTFSLVFRDENGNPIDPEFESAAAENAASPFEVRISRGDNEDIAQERGIVVEKSPQVGYYTFTVSGLEAGRYTVQVNLSPESPQLIDRFEYQPEFLGARVAGQPLTFNAELRVEANPAVQQQQTGALVAFGLLVTLVTVWAGVNIEKRIAPLSGRLAIYRLPRKFTERKLAEEVWTGDLPTKRNFYRFPTSKLSLWDPPVNLVEARTGRRRRFARAGSAEVTLRVDGQRQTMTVYRDQWPDTPFFEDSEASYFLVKDYQGGGN